MKILEYLHKLLHAKNSDKNSDMKDDKNNAKDNSYLTKSQPPEPTEEELKRMEEMEERRRCWEEEYKKACEEARRMSEWAWSETRSLEELTRDYLNQLYELVDKKMAPIGKYEEESVTYPIPKTRCQVILTAKSHSRNPELREFILGVCSIHSDCMHSYYEFEGTYEELKTYLLTQDNIDELVKDCTRLKCSVED